MKTIGLLCGHLAGWLWLVATSIAGYPSAPEMADLGPVLEASPGPVLVIPAGDWTHDDPIVVGEGSRFNAIRGVSHQSSRLHGVEIEVRGRGNGRFNQAITDGLGPLDSNCGCEVRDLQMIGRGIAVSGDAVLVHRVTVWDAPNGIRQLPGEPAVRESAFVDLHCRRCGVGVFLDQPIRARGDGINNLRFERLIVAYSDRHAVYLRNDRAATNEIMRGIEIDGMLLHSRGYGDQRPASLLIEGRVTDVDIDSRWIGGRSYPVIRLAAIGSAVPEYVRISGHMTHQSHHVIAVPAGARVDASGLTTRRVPERQEKNP